MRLRALLLATVCCAVVANSAVAQTCHCSEDKSKDLAVARKMLQEMRDRKPSASPIPIIQPTPRIARGSSQKIDAGSTDSALNSSEKK